tara:strand:+ start:163 stop:504 length:342 start_codon:yes stop_codon:yes gene_type:complete
MSIYYSNELEGKLDKSQFEPEYKENTLYMTKPFRLQITEFNKNCNGTYAKVYMKDNYNDVINYILIGGFANDSNEIEFEYNGKPINLINNVNFYEYNFAHKNWMVIGEEKRGK